MGRLKERLVQAQADDEEALSKVRHILKEAPRLARIFVDVTNIAACRFINRLSGDNPLAQETLPPQLKARGVAQALKGFPMPRRFYDSLAQLKRAVLGAFRLLGAVEVQSQVEGTWL